MELADPMSTSFLGMPYWLVGAILTVALFGAFQVYYWVGHKVGDTVYESRLGRRIGQERIIKVENVVRKWGALAVYGCFFVPGLRHTLPWVAGVLRINYRWYLVASALGCLTWAPLVWFGLYAVVWAWLGLAADSPVVAVVLAVVVAVALVAYVLWRRRGRGATTASQAG